MTATSLRTLRRYLPGKQVERCELCGAELPRAHGHLIDIQTRRFSCACEACSVLFVHRGNSGLRRTGRRVCVLLGFRMTDAEWEDLRIPIGLAFFVTNDENHVTALYPGPAGPIESLLTLHSWSGIVWRNPILQQMEPEVEALLVNRIGDRRDYYLAPIDRCYELAGLIRTHWRGLSGGDEVWRQIAEFFALLEEAGRA